MDTSKHKIQELYELNTEYRLALKKIRYMLESNDLGIHRGKEKLYEILDSVLFILK